MMKILLLQLSGMFAACAGFSFSAREYIIGLIMFSLSVSVGFIATLIAEYPTWQEAVNSKEFNVVSD